MIQRKLHKLLQQRLGKAILLVGPRQTGKTTLLRQFAENLGDYLLLDADDPLIQQQLTAATSTTLKRIIGTYKVVFIDEAQRIPNIGLTLKIITDQMPEIQLLVSGSSALELANQIKEPLTGRKWEYQLFPISWEELRAHKGYIASLQELETRLLFGMYPEVVTYLGQERPLLKQLASSYLYKDLFTYEDIRKPALLERLLQALAFQLGNEVSLNELGRTLGVDTKTVDRYIDLLEKTFVVYRLPAFSRNLRNEIVRTRKIYFYDNGIRNALIANFSPLGLRQDTGALWENFLIGERLKLLHYREEFVNRYFWRTKTQQEIDYIEERGGKLHAYEFKWNPKKKKVRFPSAFLKAYPESVTQEAITQENFDSFLTGV